MSRGKVLQLYRTMLRESKKFENYNFRSYALEKTKYEFRLNKEVSDPAVLQKLLQQAEDNLAVVKRQVIIGELYGEGHLVIENKTKT